MRFLIDSADIEAGDVVLEVGCGTGSLTEGLAEKAGAVVSVCGGIGFVGLVVPHMVRAMMGSAPGRILLPSALLGGALLIGADMITRLITDFGNLRLGVVTAIIGAPVFLLIVYRTRESMR